MRDEVRVNLPLPLSVQSVIIPVLVLQMPADNRSEDQRSGGREDAGLLEHLCRLITPLTSAPTIPQASMLQRSMYTSTKPLFTSSSSQLFTFIYRSLFFICWFSPPSGLSEWESVFLRGCFVHIYQPEMKYALWGGGIPPHLYLFCFAVMALSKAQSCPR